MIATFAPRRLTCAETAKLVRKALAIAFPGCKFSVRSETYSGGASIDVRWTDGPTVRQVEAVAKRYSGATFDGMIDLKESHTSTLNGETVHFGADFVFCERSFSVPFYKRVAAIVCVKWGYAVPPVTQESDGSAYIANGHAYPRVQGYYTLADLIRQEAIQMPAPGYGTQED